MQNVTVSRYRKGFTADGTPHIGNFWQGYIEPADKSWIVFIDVDGRPLVFLDRDPVTGAVAGPSLTP